MTDRFLHGFLHERNAEQKEAWFHSLYREHKFRETLLGLFTEQISESVTDYLQEQDKKMIRQIETVDRQINADELKQISDELKAMSDDRPFAVKYSKELKQIEKLAERYMTLKDRILVIKDDSCWDEFVALRKRIDRLARELPQKELYEWCNTKDPEEGEEWKG